MRYYQRDDDDKILSVNRCFFDAQNGKVDLALESIKDLQEEFPMDSNPIYAEALIRSQYLGQGIQAKKLYQKAYDINHHVLAACNATIFAQDEADFKKWAKISLEVSKDDIEHIEYVKKIQKDIENGLSLWEYNLLQAQILSESKEYGVSASHAELALSKCEMSNQNEAEQRRLRAQNLRALDVEAQSRRQNLGESFLPEERLALSEALAELDKAIKLDEYDPELWNLKSAWNNLIGKYEDAISSANRAIELRPYNNPKPHYNKALALRDLKKYEEGLESAKESLKQSDGEEYAIDATQAQKLIDNFSKSRSIIDLDDIRPLILKILDSARTVSQQEISQHQADPNSGNFSLDSIAFNIRDRSRHFSRESVNEYLSMLSELLIYFTPETVFLAVLNIGEQDNTVHENCIFAGIYLAAKGEGVISRDAARFVTLTILGAVDLQEIRKYYRNLVLKPSAAATYGIPNLDEKIRKELKRINPEFPELISDQESVDENGKYRVTDILLSKYASAEHKPPSVINASIGFAFVLIILLIIVAVAMKLLGIW